MDDDLLTLYSILLGERKRVPPPPIDPRAFIEESNLIEGIVRPPTEAELNEFERFMALPTITIKELQAFVGVYEPGAVLRSKKGMNVRVGGQRCPPGGRQLVASLTKLLSEINNLDAHSFHCDYETLHPLTDCNGRSGRMIWAWMVGNANGCFLREFYYATLYKHRS